jgi:hypothetical protein
MAKKTAKRQRRAVGSQHVDWSRYKLLDLYIAAATIDRKGVGPKGLPSHLRSQVSCVISQHEELRNQFHCNITFHASASYGENAIPALIIRAEFISAYEFPFAAPFDNSEVSRFRQDYAIKHAWPYWRQFARNASLAMGLPPFPVSPMIREEDILEEVDP